jgi:tetratricopeptide (TPR) repeat protein
MNRVIQTILPIIALAVLLSIAHARGILAGSTRTAEPLDKLLKHGEDAEARDDFAAAGKDYKKATQQYPSSAKAWCHYGEYLRFYAHDSARARDAFVRSVTASENDPAAKALAWRGLGEIEQSAGNTDTALAHFLASVQIHPLADTHRSICHLQGHRGNMEEAAKHAALAVELSKDDPIALLLYAAQLERLGKREEGRAAFAKGLKLGGCEPDGSHDGAVHCCVLFNAAGYYAVCGDKPGMLRMLEAFFKTPNHRHVTREQCLTDPDFKAFVKDPAFLKLLEQHLPAAR